MLFANNEYTRASATFGKRYRRQDEIGTPFCLTIDGDTLADDTVTIRDRDSMAQDRIPAANARRYIEDRVGSWAPED